MYYIVEQCMCQVGSKKHIFLYTVVISCDQSDRKQQFFILLIQNNDGKREEIELTLHFGYSDLLS